jgi:hypothetical protein
MAKPNNQSFMLPLLKFLGVLLLVSPFACAQTPSGQNVNGSWTATFADSTGSGTLSLTVIQTESGHVSGTYTSSLGGSGLVDGAVQGDQFNFTLAQSLKECPGTYTGKVTISPTGASGQFGGKDCIGDHENGVVSLKRVEPTSGVKAQTTPEVRVQTSAAHPRIFVVDRDSFQASGGFVGIASNGSATTTGHYHAGVQRVNTEQVKSLNHACHDAVITSNPENADFVVVWDTKTWQQTSWSGHQNEFNVYDRTGELAGSGATHQISNAASEICSIVTRNPHQ